MSGRLRPVTEKPVPVTPSFDNETLAFPVFVSVTVSATLAPVVTLPKLNELGEADKVRTGATPLPDRAAEAVGVAELLISVSVPANEATDAGAKLTVKAEAPPGEIVNGTVMPERAKSAPETDACVIERLAVPVLETVNVCVFVTPVVTLPKAAEVGTSEIFALEITLKLTALLVTPPTATATFPVVAPFGTDTTMLVALQLVGVPVVPLNLTRLVPWLDPKFVPVIVTVVPTAPEVGDTLVMLGAVVTVALFNTKYIE